MRLPDVILGVLVSRFPKTCLNRFLFNGDQNPTSDDALVGGLLSNLSEGTQAVHQSHRPNSGCDVPTDIDEFWQSYASMGVTSASTTVTHI